MGLGENNGRDVEFCFGADEGRESVCAAINASRSATRGVGRAIVGMRVTTVGSGRDRFETVDVRDERTELLPIVDEFVMILVLAGAP